MYLGLFILAIYFAYLVTGLIFFPGLWLLVLLTFPFWWPVFWYDVPIYVVNPPNTVEPVKPEPKYRRVTKNPVLNF